MSDLKYADPQPNCEHKPAGLTHKSDGPHWVSQITRRSVYTQVAQETVKNLGVPAVSCTCANMIDDAVYHTSTGWGTRVKYALPLEAFQKSCKAI